MQTASPPSASLRPRAVPRTASGAPRAASRASRALSLVYGSLIYVFFLATFLYAIGFVTGLLVPKTVNDGARVPMGEALPVNGGLLALFALQHTLMARKAFKRRWTRIVPAQVERATFVLVTCLILSALFWQWRSLPGTLWEVRGPAAWFLHGVSSWAGGSCSSPPS